MSLPAIQYRIQPVNPFAHLFLVSCVVETPAPDGQCFFLPAWIPGSYLIRDFARHVVSMRAEANGRPVKLTKRDKHTWQAAPIPKGQPLELTYEVYAWDLSVRGAHLDQTHGFFNGTSVFLGVCGQEEAPCVVELLPPDGEAYTAWRVATALEPALGHREEAKPYGFGAYRAANYDELIDSPVEMGEFSLASFEAAGVPHDIAITGVHDCDFGRLTADLKKVCEWQIAFFGNPAPMKRYVFLVTAVGDGYGGLEHRASTALLCSRHDLPFAGMKGLPESYRTFLGLCSHEYFHTWNVKRIKPSAFVPYDLTRENYTRQLWAYEGITSYYDDLALLRAGVISLKDWCELLAKTINNVLAAPGRFRQSLADSSFDAWSKFYRPDENTPNAVVSYYAKGALAALALDLTLRQGSKSSLDQVMQVLWERHGKTGIGTEDGVLLKIAEELSGLNLKHFFKETVYGTKDLPLKKLLTSFGLEYAMESAALPSLGIKTAKDGHEVKLSVVCEGSAAQRAGLSAGDVLVAINGLKVTGANLDKILGRLVAGQSVAVHAFRRDELMSFNVVLETGLETCRLAPGKDLKRRRKIWLGV